MVWSSKIGDNFIKPMLKNRVGFPEGCLYLVNKERIRGYGITSENRTKCQQGSLPVTPPTIKQIWIMRTIPPREENCSPIWGNYRGGMGRNGRQSGSGRGFFGKERIGISTCQVSAVNGGYTELEAMPSYLPE
jgi:hypothetical protein